MAESNGGTVALAGREGGSGPAMVLLHGMGGDHTIWNEVFEPLSRTTRLFAPDLRGHGRTPTPDQSTFTLEELAGDLRAYLDAKGIEQAHLVGLSAGGFLALRFALEHPTRVRSLALIASAAQVDGHTRAVVEHWAEVYRLQGYEAYVQRLLKDLHYPDWLDANPDAIEDAIRTLRHHDLRGSVQWALALRRFDLRGQLSRIRAPTTVVHGMDDRVIDPSHARLIRQAILGSELKLFPFVGHLVPVERPRETGQLLAEWAAKVGAASPSG